MGESINNEQMNQFRLCVCVCTITYTCMNVHTHTHAHLVPYDRVDGALLSLLDFYLLVPESVQSNLFRPSPSPSHLRLL